MPDCPDWRPLLLPGKYEYWSPILVVTTDSKASLAQPASSEAKTVIAQAGHPVA
jgi:hypothetical protein